jgi:hypothetical protein
MNVDTGAQRKRTLPLIEVDDQVAVGQTDLDPVALRGWLYSATVAKLKSTSPSEMTKNRVQIIKKDACDDCS